MHLPRGHIVRLGRKYLAQSLFPFRTICTAPQIVERSTHRSSGVTLSTVDPPSLGPSSCPPPGGTSTSIWQPKTYKLYSRNHIQALFERHAPHLDPLGYIAAATVFPMRTNNYVVEEVIDWSNVPNDPIFKLVFPQPDMLSPEDFNAVRNVLLDGSSKVARRDVA